MALKTIMLRKKIDKKKEELEALNERSAELEKREQEIETAIDEASTEDEQRAVEEEIEKYEKEKKEHEEKKGKLEEDVKKLEDELKKEEEGAPTKKKVETTAGDDKEDEEKKRRMGKNMEKRVGFFGMNMQERSEFFARDDVKGFLQEVRTCIKEKRALTNVGLTIPDVVLPMIREKTEETSKLMKYVTVRKVTGTSRQNIMGEIPEAYWDEMCATLKELDLVFYNMEMDGYKASGFFAVCNAILEDSDVNLATELINAIGKAIGKAIDKAIVYGKGVKMPMGIVTSLLKTEAPEGYPATGREWKNLSKTNVVSGTTENAEGMELFKDIAKAAGVIDNDYDTSEIVWIMNKKTHMNLVAESIGQNSAAAIVAGMNNTMPIVGGNIVELKFIPDNTFIFGYLRNYTLIERAGTTLGQSEHVRFFEDQTVFRGTARYDGQPAIREAFGLYGIGGAPDTKAPLFAGESDVEGSAAGLKRKAK